MAKHFLNGAQVRAAREEVGRKGMSQQMGFDRPVDPSTPRVLLNDDPQGFARKRAAPLAEEEGAAGFGFDEVRPARGQVVGQGRGGLATDRNHALLGALAKDPEHTVFEINLLQQKPAQLGYTEAAGVEQFQHGPVAQRE